MLFVERFKLRDDRLKLPERGISKLTLFVQLGTNL